VKFIYRIIPYHQPFSKL